MVGRPAVHRRRHHVLVRGHLPEQGPDPEPGRPTWRSTASRARSRRSTRHRPLQVRGPYSLLPRTRSPRSASPATSPTARSADGPVRAEPLPEAVPSRSTPTRPRSSQMAKEAKFDNWVALLQDPERLPRSTPICPTLTPWKTVTPINTPTGRWSATRTTTRSTPTATSSRTSTRSDSTLAENLEVLNLRAIAGEYDVQERHIDIAKLPVFLENQQKGNYTVKSGPWPHGSDAGFYINQSYEADPEIAQVAAQQRLPPARSRWASTATSSTRSSGSASATRAASRPAERRPTTPARSGARRSRRFDVKQANELLDKIGLTRRTPRASACAPTARAGSCSRSRPSAPRSSTGPASPR